MSDAHAPLLTQGVCKRDARARERPAGTSCATSASTGLTRWLAPKTRLRHGERGAAGRPAMCRRGGTLPTGWHTADILSSVPAVLYAERVQRRDDTPTCFLLLPSETCRLYTARMCSIVGDSSWHFQHFPTGRGCSCCIWKLNSAVSCTLRTLWSTAPPSAASCTRWKPWRHRCDGAHHRRNQ
jgi:hypothetical protein